MDSAVSGRGRRGHPYADTCVYVHMKRLLDSQVYLRGELKHEHPLRVPRFQTATHAFTCDKPAGSAVQTCTHMRVFADLFEATLTHTHTQMQTHFFFKKGGGKKKRESRLLPHIKGASSSRVKLWRQASSHNDKSHLST